MNVTATGPGRAMALVTFVVAAGAVLLQLVLVLQGHSPLAPEARPAMPEAVRRFFSYFTIQSNLLVAATSFCLATGRGTGSRLFPPARVAALVGITVTGVVHFFLLRPLLTLTGVDAWADRLLHVVVPLLAVLGWLLVGPWSGLRRQDAWWALVWPVVWLGATLALGPVVDWYPYPFLDVDTEGVASVALTSVGIGVLFTALALAVVTVDTRLGQRAPVPARTGHPQA